MKGDIVLIVNLDKCTLTVASQYAAQTSTNIDPSAIDNYCSSIAVIAPCIYEDRGLRVYQLTAMRFALISMLLDKM